MSKDDLQLHTPLRRRHFSAQMIFVGIYIVCCLPKERSFHRIFGLTFPFRLLDRGPKGCGITSLKLALMPSKQADDMQYNVN